jgi:hypothetical protein
MIMKKIIKYSFLLSLSLLLAVACRDEEAVRMPKLQQGVNSRVVLDANHSFLDFGNLATASVVFDIYSQNKNIDKLTFAVNYNDVSDATAKFPIGSIEVAGSSFVNGKASVTLTSQQIVDMFQLPGGVNYIGGGDNLVFTQSAKLTDGRVVNAANSAPSITGGTNASFTPNFTVLVACAFNVDEAVGTYSITRDDAGVSAPGDDLQVEVVAGPGANEVTLKDLFGYPEKYDVIVTVNPANGAATIAKQKAWDADILLGDFGEASIAGGGFFLSCAGSLDVVVEHTVDAGSFGNYALRLDKN